MLLSDMSIKRPIVAIVASILLLVFGLYAFFQLPVRETPNIERPIIGIGANYPGASAEVVESKVVKVIEDAVSGVEGVVAIQSFSRDGRGQVTLEFIEGHDIDVAANDIRDKVSRIIGRLPEEMDEMPRVEKADADSSPIIVVNINGSRSPMELSDYAVLELQPRFAALKGVATINTPGVRRKAMRIWLDRRAMAARGLTVTEIQTALRRENVELGAGQLESTDVNFTLRTIRTFQTPEDFNNLVIARGENNYLIRLGEVAKVELAPRDDHGIFRTNGIPAVALAIIKQPNASTLDVANLVKAEIEAVRKTLPPDLRIMLGTDTSLFIAAAIHEVSIAVGVAAILVILVIYLFLGSMRAAIIPAVAVPISLIATSIVLWPAGFSINILTLLAMVLAIGLVVDDAIIMVENIHRRMKLGEPPLLAALRGSRQVGMAVVSTTLVLVAAFVPIALLQGSVGALFKEFAVSMAVAVVCSMFVSLTLTPVMCSKILTPALDHGKVARMAEEAFEKMQRLYVRWLNQALDSPRLVMVGFAAIVAMSGLFFTFLPQEFAPREDRGNVFLQIRAPDAANGDYTARQMEAAVSLLKPYLDSGEISRITENMGGNNNMAQVTLWMAPWSERTRSTSAFVAEINPKLRQITGAQVIANLPAGLGRGGGGGPGGGGGGGGGVMLAISGPTYDDLRVWRDAMMQGLAGNPMFASVRNSFTENKPQIRIRIDQVRASDLGVSVGDIGDALSAMLGSRRVGTFVEGGEEYDVILQSQDSDRVTPNDVSNIYIRSATTRQLIPLSSLVTLEEGSYAEAFIRLDRRRTFNMFLNPRPDVILGDAIREVERIAAETLPSEALLTWRGEAGDFKNNSAAIYFSFALALLVVFLVLAAQFESFMHPVIIMMTVPLAVFGALAGLLLFGQTINLFSQIGIIVLVGLAAKNGILIVEFANQLRDAGREFRDAIVEASVIRLRPIVMTALATAVGALPLVLGTGAGYEARRPIGIVIFTGVSFAVVVTLVVVPTFYMMFARRTGSPGRVAAELKDFEKRFPSSGAADNETQGHGPTPGHQPAE